MRASELLKKAREALGLTQEQLAERFRTTRQTITRYEIGTHRIPFAVQLAVNRKGDTVELRPANDAMNPIIVKPTDTLRIGGVVIGLIRYCRMK